MVSRTKAGSVHDTRGTARRTGARVRRRIGEPPAVAPGLVGEAIEHRGDRVARTFGEREREHQWAVGGAGVLGQRLERVREAITAA